MYLVKEQLLAHNRSYKALNPQGYVIHSTATPGATAQNEFTYFNGGDRKASAHYFVDWTDIIRTIPEKERAWHAGGTANKLYLSVEMCEPSGSDRGKFAAVWKRTVWLVAEACIRYGWSAQKVFSHQQISNMYKETNHIDPAPYFTQYGKTWEQFLQEVTEMISILKTQNSGKG